MNVFLWNARARNGHVEATLNHPFPAQVKLRSPGVANDTFCEAACDCPGQVNWHAGWKMQRFRGVHMALAYLDMFQGAVDEYKALLAAGAVPPRWPAAHARGGPSVRLNEVTGITGSHRHRHRRAIC